MRCYGAANLREKAGRVIWGGLIGLALVRRAGQTVEKTEPVVAAQTTAEESPFEALFGEGYDFLAPHS